VFLPPGGENRRKRVEVCKFHPVGRPSVRSTLLVSKERE
jgi:hypothetical protein